MLCCGLSALSSKLLCWWLDLLTCLLASPPQELGMLEYELLP